MGMLFKLNKIGGGRRRIIKSFSGEMQKLWNCGSSGKSIKLCAITRHEVPKK
jgi:hypothetical protein